MKHGIIGRAHCPPSECITSGLLLKQRFGCLQQSPHHRAGWHASPLILVHDFFFLKVVAVQEHEPGLASREEFGPDVMKGIQPIARHLVSASVKIGGDAKDGTAVKILFGRDGRTHETGVSKPLLQEPRDDFVDLVIGHHVLLTGVTYSTLPPAWGSRAGGSHSARPSAYRPRRTRADPASRI